ncbi:MAG TPA: hypothetical protein DDZ68_01610, partial [Parvularcula sp.]|nr:hypothetical protein [Parvularcula sp.]
QPAGDGVDPGHTKDVPPLQLLKQVHRRAPPLFAPDIRSVAAPGQAVATLNPLSLFKYSAPGPRLCWARRSREGGVPDMIPLAHRAVRDFP